MVGEVESVEVEVVALQKLGVDEFVATLAPDDIESPRTYFLG
jgi:hypothetical protein